MEDDNIIDLAQLFIILRLAFYVTFSGVFCLSLAAGVWIPAAILYFRGAHNPLLMDTLGFGMVYMIVSQVSACMLMAFFPWDKGLSRLVDAIMQMTEEA